MHATCPAHLILHHFITLILSVEKYNNGDQYSAKLYIISEKGSEKVKTEHNCLMLKADELHLCSES
jgi:hypothetical protein